MAIEDIERLKEKTEKDPNSKLFVPLAEEYKKAGMLDEAVDVLIKGLERQPAYLSARVSLGKIYLEKGSLEEAMAEFEKVITAIPDNLYAHKKLAGIYKDLGRKEAAAKEFKTVLKLNPMDEAAAADLSSMEQEEKVQSPETAVEAPVEMAAYGELEEAFRIQEPQPETDETQFAPSFSEGDLEIPEAVGEESKVEEPENIPPAEAEGEMWVDTIGEFDQAGGPPDTPPKTAVSEEDMALWRAHLDEVEGGQALDEAEPVPQAGEPVGEEPISFEDMLAEPESELAETAAEELPVAEEAGAARSIEDADRSIAEGRYGEAMSIYRSILSSGPDNKHALQRVEELRALLKLLGKDKEELVVKLERFLDAVKKRRDEFSGNA